MVLAVSHRAITTNGMEAEIGLGIVSDITNEPLGREFAINGSASHLLGFFATSRVASRFFSASR